MERGYVKLNCDKILYCGVLQHGIAFQLFIKILLDATQKETRIIYYGQVVDLKPGDYVTNVQSLCNELKISRAQCRLAIKKLKAFDLATSVSTNKYTIFSITNWNEYID